MNWGSYGCVKDIGHLMRGRSVQPREECEAFRASQLPCLKAGATSEHLSHSVFGLPVVGQLEECLGVDGKFGTGAHSYGLCPVFPTTPHAQHFLSGPGDI